MADGPRSRARPRHCRLQRRDKRLRMTLEAGRPESAASAASWDLCLGVSLPFWSITGAPPAPPTTNARAERPGRSRSRWRTWPLRRPARELVPAGLLDAYGEMAPGAWGRDGYLNVIPTAFILARGITVTAAMPSDEKTYARRTFDAGGAIRVGPFTLAAARRRRSFDHLRDDEHGPQDRRHFRTRTDRRLGGALPSPRGVQ